ncbi:MAG: prepilin-type N-terminal cleavage/methylation domain-containing protein [Acidobacteria bacterium]|nr:prepilin-type N-terminal cleavage/methylation domain-containing protein [Acidobacteriota bacterium]
MRPKNQGFSMLEILVVIAIIGIIAAFALPSAITFVKGYRLHANASAIAAQLNVTRFRATSQYTPYRLRVSTSAGTTARERLSTAYGSPQSEESIPLDRGVRFLSACPVSAKPGTIGASVTAASPAIYFNTRGLPVDSTGITYNNNVIYLANDNDLYDAVTVSLGGKVSIWNYNATAGAWVSR